MFYPAGLALDTIIDAMSEAQFRIRERLPIKIGLCIHPGRFYEIGGGLYGKDADIVEDLAEQFAGPGEILLTEQAVGKLKSVAASELTRREAHPGAAFSEPAYLLRSSRRMSSLQEVNTDYPHPFPPDFYQLLSKLGATPDADALKQNIYQEWLRKRVVVFLSRQRQAPESESLSTLLDDLVINALMDTIVREVMHLGDHIASSGGGLAILTFDSGSGAIDAARAVRAKCVENGLPVQIGIDIGDVLFFQGSRAANGIAGDPVNIASKLAEEIGKPGCITVTDRTLQGLASMPEGERFEALVSGIKLQGLVLL
jgi:class 3 adenylate cyclase